jgi:hypothetical protein
MLRYAFVACLLATPVLAEDTKEVSCGYEAQVMAAVQQARLDRVKKEDLTGHIAGTSPAWPDNYSAAIPQMAEFVYGQKRKDLRKQDLGVLWQEQCLATWDQRQEMLKNLNN